jgi:hypothetical protein
MAVLVVEADSVVATINGTALFSAWVEIAYLPKSAQRFASNQPFIANVSMPRVRERHG